MSLRRIDERPAVKESSPLGRRFGSAWSTFAERFAAYRLTPVLAIAFVIAFPFLWSISRSLSRWGR